MRFKRAHLFIPAALLLTAAAACAAQEIPRLDGSNVKQRGGWAVVPPAAPATTSPTAKPSPAIPLGASAPADATASSASGAPSPADRPAQPASVQFNNGMLTVHATNASLAQILRDTAVQTGMQMEGTPEDERVFGDFGPAPVSKVLAQLLDGGPSNYLLFGRRENLAPRSLVIMPRASLAPGEVLAQAPAPTVTASEDDDDDDTPAPVAPIRPLIPAGTQPLGQAAPGSGGAQPGIRTPQQILEDMQRRRQSQQQPQE